MLDLMGGILAAAAEAPAAVTETAAAVVSHWNVLGVVGAVLGAGIIVFGAAMGIGRIASCACEAIARQPEAGGRIFTTMLLASALIEGGMLLALIICFLAMWRLSQ
ncbi:MAG: ATP synthase F0 subunit C [Phycisphaerae bacterium]|nr:ATP synthase F0 subunit C [Phycisphaerae bacterium]